jgi:hypothetical protein
MPTIVSIEDLMGAREKGWVFVLCPTCPPEQKLMRRGMRFALCKLWGLAGGANTRTIQRRGSQKK